jgi:uncharacterized protein YcbX
VGIPILSKLRIYPIKSLDPIELNEAEVGAGSLRYDREFALLAQDGHFVNGKRTGRVNELKATYDLSNDRVHLQPRTGTRVDSFHLLNDRLALEAYFTAFFNEPVSLVRNQTGQLMDIPDVSGVTITNQQTLESLQSDLSDRTLENLRLRFRANIEITGAEAFWEEQYLIAKPGTGIRFRMGEVEMIGVSPRARCNVPPRDPVTGVTDKSFIKQMMTSRSISLPANSPIPGYGSLYQLNINVHLPAAQRGKWLHVGDPVKLIGPVDLSSIFEGV